MAVKRNGVKIVMAKSAAGITAKISGRISIGGAGGISGESGVRKYQRNQSGESAWL